MKKIILLILLFSTFNLCAISRDILELSQSSIAAAQLNKYISEFPQNEYTICKVPYLGAFYIDNIGDSIKEQLRQGIYWESGIADYVKTYTKPGTIAIDLGAHIGIHTITMSRCVQPRGHVIAFEPQWKMFRELYHNLRLNNCHQNVVLLPLAAGEIEQEIEMTARDPRNEGGTPIGRGGNKAQMITIDSLNLDNVSFIKMDVESYELNVLKGARETLLRNRPVIVFEILGGYDLDACKGKIREQYMETVYFLKSLNYRVDRIFGNDFIATPK